MPLYAPEYIDTLAARGDAKALIKALRDSETSELAKSALIKLGEAAIRPLVRALRDGGVSFMASQVLKEIGPPAVEPLVRALKEKRGSGYAAAVLEDIGEPSVLALIDALEGGRELTLVLGVRALGVIGDGRAVVPIRRVFFENLTSDADQLLQEVCLNALNNLGIELKYTDEDEVALDEFKNDLEGWGYSKRDRPKDAYVLPQVPGIRFRVMKRIVRLESRVAKDAGGMEWKRVRSYSIKSELWLASRVAELVMKSHPVEG
jgi:hypothetical protein